MASVLELEELVLRERDRVIDCVSESYGVGRDEVAIKFHNVVGTSYDVFDVYFDRGRSFSDVYKFRFSVYVGGSEVSFFGIKLFRKSAGSYVCLLYVPGYEPKDVLEGCAHYFYGVYDDVSYEKTMRVLLDHLREVLKGLMGGGKRELVDHVEVVGARSEEVDVVEVDRGGIGNSIELVEVAEVVEDEWHL